MTAHAVAAALPRSSNDSRAAAVATSRLWAGRLLSGAATVFFLIDGGMKLFKPPVVVEATRQLGFPETAIVGIGLTLLACTLLYVIPRTAVFGAVLLTGYLGGAVATQLRVGGSWFTILFPVVFGAIVWAGLYLRDARLRALLHTSRS